MSNNYDFFKVHQKMTSSPSEGDRLNPLGRVWTFIRHTTFIWPNTLTKRWDVMFNRIRTKRKRAVPFNWIMLFWNVSILKGCSLWATTCIWIMSFEITIVTYIPPDTFSILWATTFNQHMTQMKWWATMFIRYTSSNWNTRVMCKGIESVERQM